MFKINWSRDLLNKDPTKRNRKTGIIVTCGYTCGEHCWCQHGGKCRYSKSFYWLHNASVDFRNWFERKFGIRLPLLIYIQKLYTDLSGTTKCPYNMPRVRTCKDCKYCYGYPDGSCRNEERRRLIKDEKYNETAISSEDPCVRRCKFFEINPSFEKYDKKTGEHIWNK